MGDERDVGVGEDQQRVIRVAAKTMIDYAIALQQPVTVRMRNSDEFEGIRANPNRSKPDTLGIVFAVCCPPEIADELIDLINGYLICKKEGSI